MFKLDYKNYLSIIVFSLPSTFISASLLYIINIFLTKDIESLSQYLLPVFFCFIIYSFLLNIYFQSKLLDLNYKMIYENEVKILSLLHQSSFKNFLKFGSQRFYTVLEDLRVFIYLPNILITLINSLLTIIICLGYLFWISMETTLILSLFLILIVGLYLFINKKLSKRYEYLRKLNEEYYGYVDDSIKGFKELKISAIRRENFFTNHLGNNRKKAMKVDISLTKKYLILNLLSQNGIYLLLGLVFIILIYLHSLDSEQIITYVVALLFLNGPINGLISMQSFLIKAIVSNKRIKRFFSDFKQEKVCDWEKVKNYGFNNLKFDDIKFSYDSENQFNFAIERLSLSIEKGEIIFITGGNGSGKSTFVNILTGLYSPNKGKILLNGEEINNLESSYKDLFAVIYSNNYIFSKNYNNYSFEGNNYYKELLKIMQMDDTVLDDREASIRRKFSKGQSKRMSLILALLEDKPILVLDEWAADQDPYFRKYFYEELIPMLKRRGKTIIAVTHDDAYFKQADRIIKFEYGTISESKLVSNIPT